MGLMPKPDKPVVVALFPEEGVAEAPSHVAVQVLALWNEYAERVNAAAGETIWEGATALTVKRRRRINVATKDYGGVHAMRGYLEKAAQNNFLLKQTKRIDKFKDWKPNFDWFLHEDTIVKFIENRFTANTMTVEERKAPTPVNWRARLESYHAKGFWLPSDGRRPEDPGPHLAPADMILQWRKDRGLAEVAPPVAQETREQRMASSIVSWRKHGQYDRANKIEEDLARLENRPAVLVPAPAVAQFGMDRPSEPIPEPKRPAGHSGPPRAPVTDLDEPPAWTGDDVPEGAMHEADD